MIRDIDVALSLLAVGVAAVAGYVLRTGRSRTKSGRTKANVGARIVEDIPSGATVVDVSSRRLETLPGALRAIEQAVRHEAREEWEHVTLENAGAWNVVDTLRGSLPYHDGEDGEYNGVYVRCDDRVVVLDAIGWAKVEGQLQ